MAIKQIFWIASAVLLFAGCSKDNNPAPASGFIAFNGAVDEYPVQPMNKYSRSADFVEGTTFAIDDQIGVLGYALPQDVWTGKETPALMYNSELTKIADKTFRYNPMVPWPSTGKASFFAYYPYSGSVTDGIITPSASTQSGYPSVTVVLGKSDEPIDFMTGKKGATDYATSGGTIVFTFSHRLTKLLFLAIAPDLEKDTRLYVNSLRIRNIYNKAVYSFDDNEGSWGSYGNESTLDAVTGATLNFNSATHAVSSTEYTNLLASTTQDAYLLMLPQTYSSTELEVSYTLEYLKAEGGCEYHVMGTKSMPIEVDWKMGELYAYRLMFVVDEVSGIDVKVNVLRPAGDSEWKEEVNVGTEIN